MALNASDPPVKIVSVKVGLPEMFSPVVVQFVSAQEGVPIVEG